MGLEKRIRKRQRAGQVQRYQHRLFCFCMECAIVQADIIAGRLVNRRESVNSIFVPNDAFSEYRYHTEILQGDDGSFTASAEEMGIIVSALTEEEACLQLAKAIFDYSQEFCANYSEYSNLPGGHEQIPYVVKAILLGCPENIIPEMVFG